MTTESDPSRLELVWPDGAGLSQQALDGTWSRIPAPPPSLYSIAGVDHSLMDGNAASCLILPGQRLTCLSAIKNLLRERIKLVYFDLPRLEIDDASAAFRSDGRPYPSWLGVVNDHLRATMPLLRDDGVVALMVGDREEPFARLLLHQLFGPDNYIGTIVWQRHYSARQVPNSREIAAIHEFILLAAKSRASLPPVAVKRLPKGLKHPDGDPRGPWKGGNKGANKPDYPYGTRVPPYRWRLVSGDLPAGIWRLNEFTGVMWAPELEAAGDYRFLIECEDSEGATVQREFCLSVTEDGDPPVTTLPVPWLWSPPVEGELGITTETLPNGVIGQPYSALIEAAGGKPYDGEKWQGSGRYQEHPKHTLEKAVREDKVMFGVKGDAIPWIKKHADPEEIVNENIYSLWLGKEPKDSKDPAGSFGDFGAGYTQDATKHLDKLVAEKSITASTAAAKPETLMNRLLQVFTETGDWVIDGFDLAADLAATALKVGRRAVFLAGDSEKDREALENCSRPRLQAVADLKDSHGVSVDGDGEEGTNGSYNACVSAVTGGNVVLGTLIGPFAMWEDGDQYPTLKVDEPFDSRVFMISQGYLPVSDTSGRSIDGSRICEIISPECYLDEMTLADIVDRYSNHGSAVGLSVYYFKALELPEVAAEAVDLVRIPFDLLF